MFEIVKMNPMHIESLAQIELECFSLPWSKDALTQELCNPLAVFFVAIKNGCVCGYIGMHNVSGEGYITNIAVSSYYRKQRIASKLVESLLQYAHQYKMNFITLEVRASNIIAIDLYQKYCFKQVGQRKKFYSKPKEDAIIMTFYLHD